MYLQKKKKGLHQKFWPKLINWVLNNFRLSRGCHLLAPCLLWIGPVWSTKRRWIRPPSKIPLWLCYFD